MRCHADNSSFSTAGDRTTITAVLTDEDEALIVGAAAEKQHDELETLREEVCRLRLEMDTLVGRNSAASPCEGGGGPSVVVGQSSLSSLNPGQSGTDEPPSSPRHDGDLATWLRIIGMERFTNKFYDAGVQNMELLCELDAGEVSQLMLDCGFGVGHKRVFPKVLAEYKRESGNWETEPTGVLFDPSKQYRVMNAAGHTAGATMYPVQVTPHFLMLEQSGSTKARVDYSNKTVLRRVIDGNFENDKAPATSGILVQAETSIWVDMDDTAVFDPLKQYRVMNASAHTAGATMYPVQVTPHFLMLEQSGSTKARVDYCNKTVLRRVIDGNFEKDKAHATSGILVQAETSIWVDMVDEAVFDPSKQYRVRNAAGHTPGATMYPVQVTPHFLMLEQSGLTKARVDYCNKTVLRHVIDGNFENEAKVTSGIVVQVKY